MNIRKLNIGQKIFLGFGVVILIMLAVIGNTYMNFMRESQAVKWNVHTYQVMQASNGLLISLLNMETSVSGYVITGNESFLGPFSEENSSYEKYYNNLKELVADNPEQKEQLDNVQNQYREWLQWEKNKIITNRKKVSSGELKLEDLIVVVQSGDGKSMMDNLRLMLKKINAEEEKSLKSKSDDLVKMEKETRTIMLIGGILATIAAIIIAGLVVRTIINPVKVVTNTFKEIAQGDVNLGVRLKSNSEDELGNMARYFNIFMTKLKEVTSENMNQSWLTTGRAELNEVTRGVEDIKTLSSNIISYLCRYLDVQIGRLYTKTECNTFKISGSYSYNNLMGTQEEFNVGEGLVGQSALEKKTILVQNVPRDYMKIISGIGEAVPKNILIVPCMYHKEIECILELGSFNKFTDIQLKFIEQVSESIAISVNLTQAQRKMKELLHKTLVQAEELQVQQEELGQNNEELEEQARVLKESEMNLQTQQEELRVLNEELEEQTRELEQQKIDIIKNNELLRKANYEMEEKVKELEVTNKYKSQFLANMSHELKTPLNSILVLSQLLANKKDNEPLTEKQLGYAETIHSSGENLLKLINDILDLSKVEAGKLDINFKKIELMELIEDTKKLFNPIALQKKIDFKLQIEKGLPKEIISDKQRIQQIVNNLLSNAFKFTNNGCVNMNICRPKVDDIEGFNIKDDVNDLISIEVTDTGIGIPEDKYKLIFEAFKQVDGTISRKYGGTGLGLSISKELANLLGGTIYLKSQEGRGSTFTLIILNRDKDSVKFVPPNEEKLNRYAEGNIIKGKKSTERLLDEASLFFHSIDLKIDNEKIKSEKSDDELKNPLINKKILIVDDDMRNVFSLSSAFEEEGMEVVIARNGMEGIKKLRENSRMDLIIMDVMMPEMDGYTAMKEIRKQNKFKDIPIIAITAKAMKDDREKCIEAGANDYLTKPVEIDKLISLLKLWLYR